MRAAVAWPLLLPLLPLLGRGCAGPPESPPGAERSKAERVAAEGVVALPLTIRQGYPLAAGVTSLTLGGMSEIGGSRALQPARPDPAAGLVAADFGFLQGGPVPDFLGFVGAPWLSTWAFSLRYSPARWLMADAGAGAERLLAGSDRVALGAALPGRYVSVCNLSRSTIDLRRDTAP